MISKDCHEKNVKLKDLFYKIGKYAPKLEIRSFIKFKTINSSCVPYKMHCIPYNRLKSFVKFIQTSKD